jgi:hypothetical protein
MKKLFAIFAVVVYSICSYATACPSSGYTQTYSLVIPAQSTIGADVSNYVVYFGGNAALKTVANGGSVQTSTAIDVVFCTAASSGTVIPYELVAGTYDATTGAGEWHILLPTISKTVSETIYAFVGNSGASDLSATTATWANYAEVLHMGTAASLSTTSSTGSNNATNTLGVAATGQFFGGVSFGTQSKYFTVSGAPSGSSARTIQGWLKTSSSTSSVVFDEGALSTSNRFVVFFNGSANTLSVDGNGIGTITASTHAIRDGAWHKWIVTLSGTTVSVKIDGFAAQTGNFSGTPNTTASPQLLAQNVDGGGVGLVSTMDEFRISSGALSADEQILEWLNESAPTTFVVFNPPPPITSARYISTSGSDSNDGLTTGTPWQTLTKVSLQTWTAGSSILLKCGDTFTGQIVGALVGSQASPILVGSYGTCSGSNNPIISAGSGTGGIDWIANGAVRATGAGIYLVDSEFFTIQNLDIRGDGWTGSWPTITVLNCGAGIYLGSTQTGGNQLRNSNITNNAVSGFCVGIFVNADASASVVGFNGLNISYNNLHDNLVMQFYSQGYNVYASGPVTQINNVYLGHNTMTNCPGNPGGPSNGGPHQGCQSVSLSSGTGMISEYNYINEGNYQSASGFSASCSMVSSNSRNVEFLRNEITQTNGYGNTDNCAFDFDADVQNSEMAYNLSYNNTGPMFQTGLGATNNTIHHNISYNDARGWSASSAMGVFRFFGTSGSNYIYNNTIYLGSGYFASSSPAIANFESSNAGPITFANNIFKVTGSLPIFRTLASVTTLKTFANVYDTSGGSLKFDNAGTYTTLSGWQAVGSGYENLAGITYGTVGNANLFNLAGFTVPSGGFLANGGLPAINYFNLTSSSTSAIGTGVDIGIVGKFLGWTDFHTSPARTGDPVDAGASAYLQPAVSGAGAGSIIIQ